MNYLVLKNKEGQVVRVFDWRTDKAFVIFCKDTNRLDIWPHLDLHKDKKDKIIVLKNLDQSQFANAKSVTLSSGHYLELMDTARADFLVCAPTEEFDLRDFRRVTMALAGVFVFLVFGLFILTDSSLEPPKVQEQIVTIVKPLALPEKVEVQSYQLYARDSKVKPIKKKVFKKSIKKLSALGALGSLSKDQSQQQAGLNLTNSKVSQGPGLRAVATNSGSGGVQSSIYSKGLITAAIGSGGNVKGGGGYNTKGRSQGGGQAGYGQLNLIGSAGNSDLSETSVLNPDGGSFDPNLIHQAINRKAGEVRNCYDEALKLEPDLKGVFSVDFSIDHQGLIKRSKTHSESQVQSKKVSECILNVLNVIKFNISSNKEPIRVIYKFDLTALKERR